MPDPTTPNIVLAQPIRGTDVGTWDVPVNGNTGILDQAFGGVTTIALSSTNIFLTSSQAQNSIIRLTGTLTANCGLVLPSIYKFWTIDNQLTNPPSSFAAVVASSGTTNQIGCPPGVQDIFYDGTTVKYRNLGQIGQYWDYADVAVPTWVNISTVPPYLNCNGTTFSSATYSILFGMIGGTLPDSRGRYRATINSGTGRITSAGSNMDGNTLLAQGGDQALASHGHTISVSDPGHTHGHNAQIDSANAVLTGGSGFGVGTVSLAGGATINAAFTGITATAGTAGTGNSQNIPPTYMGGITMIRAG